MHKIKKRWIFVRHQPLIRFSRKASVSLTMALCLVLSLIPSDITFAASANKLYTNPRKLQMNLNTTFTVDIKSYADIDQATGTARGTVTYSTSMLQLVNISTGTSNYVFSPSPNFYIAQSPGSIAFSGFRNPGTSGISHLFTLTFKAIGAGNAVVAFTPDSTVNGAVIDNNDNSGVYTITDPNPPPPTTPKPSSSPKPNTTPKPTTSTKPRTPTPAPIITSNPEPTTSPSGNEVQTVPDPTGVIDNVTVTPVYTTATIAWQVNALNASSTVRYGASTARLDKTAAITKKADGSFVAQLSDLTPGTRYMFTIAAKGDSDKEGNYTGSIPTRGYPVTIAVTENNTPVTSGQVKIGYQNSYINSSGKVTMGLAAGNYTGTITTETATLNISLTVATKPIPIDGSEPASQSFSYNLTSSILDQGPGTNNSILSFIGVMAVGAVVLGLGFVAFITYRRRRFETNSDNGYAATSTSSVIIDDGYDWKNQPQQTPTNQTLEQLPSPQNQSPIQYSDATYSTEDEPLDMFEQAAQKLPLPPSNPSLSPSRDETGHNPSSPHSTTP